MVILGRYGSMEDSSTLQLFDLLISKILLNAGLNDCKMWQAALFYIQDWLKRLYTLLFYLITASLNLLRSSILLWEKKPQVWPCSDCNSHTPSTLSLSHHCNTKVGRPAAFTPLRTTKASRQSPEVEMVQGHLLRRVTGSRGGRGQAVHFLDLIDKMLLCWSPRTRLSWEKIWIHTYVMCKMQTSSLETPHSDASTSWALHCGGRSMPLGLK